MPRPRCPWSDAAFTRDYLERYAHRSDASARAELPFLRRVLGLPRGARILDLCCGAGRHACALAGAGYMVFGVDRSRDLLRAARERRSRGARSPAYVRADMRRLPFPEASFDGVVNLFTSFGYFPSDASNARVLREAARVLKPGAPFLMDFLNLAGTLRRLVPQSERTVGGARLIERRWFDRRTRRLKKTVRIRGAGAARVLRESVRAYSPRELTALFKRAGLRVERRYGDLAGAAFNASTSARCVLLARKVG